jgi:hypothetical protein
LDLKITDRTGHNAADRTAVGVMERTGLDKAADRTEHKAADRTGHNAADRTEYSDTVDIADRSMKPNIIEQNRRAYILLELVTF